MVVRRALTLTLGLLVSACLAASAPAAQWSSPVPISDSATAIDSLQVITGDDGRALIGWSFRQQSGYGGQQFVSRRPDGRWGPRQTLGVAFTQRGPAPRFAGLGQGIFAMSPFGGRRWIGLGSRVQSVPDTIELWEGTTLGQPRLRAKIAGDAWELGTVASLRSGAAVVAWTWMQPRRGAGGNLRPRVVMTSRRTAAGRPFSTPRRLSPLPPRPPYGNNRGPALSATSVRVAYAGRTVVVAWQRTGFIEARVSRDGGASFGRTRRLGPSAEAFPGLVVSRASANGAALVLWGARENVGAQRSLVYRLARLQPGGTFTTQLLERSAPISAAPIVGDQYGPRALATFAGATPVIAWQGVDGTTVVVRAQRLDGSAPQTLASSAGQTPVLDDLVAGAGGAAALAWHTYDAMNSPVGAFVSVAAAGAPFGAAEALPGPAGATTARLAFTPQALLAAWSVRTGDAATALAATRTP